MEEVAVIVGEFDKVEVSEVDGLTDSDAEFVPVRLGEYDSDAVAEGLVDAVAVEESEDDTDGVSDSVNDLV